MKRFVFIIFAVILMSAGCKKGTEKKIESKTPKKEAEVIVPQEVQKEWKTVTIQLTDKQKNTKTAYEIEIGKSLALGDSGLTVEVLNFLPDFKMAPGEITSSSAEPKNPAAQVLIKEDGKEPIKVWLFYNYPDVHAFVHPNYQLALAGFNRAGK
jgi:hypothetical protein